MKNFKLNDYTFKEKPLLDFIKRFFDIILSFLAIVAIIVKATDPKGTVFYFHNRVGKNGKTIRVIKFRTMVSNANELIASFNERQKAEWETSFKLTNDPRITKIGAFLRKTSIDELPQLFNVLDGSLSLIGPRPITYEETLLFGEYRDLLLKVKPGITGVWAANGRSHKDYKTRTEMELYYVCKRSLWLEIKLLFKTVISVFKQEGAM